MTTNKPEQKVTRRINNAIDVNEIIKKPLLPGRKEKTGVRENEKATIL